MTGPGRFAVDHDQLHAHAAAVGDLANQLSSVAGGQSRGLPDNALGSFVQFLTSGLQSATDATTKAIGGAASGVDNVGVRLAATAHSYQDTDTSGAGRLAAVQLPEEDAR
ncbi:MAG TPA: type VII secretion target [Pseudonocardiaceae bacterium]